MGMYTEIVFRGTINRKKLGDDIFNIFDFLFNKSTKLSLEELVIPNHQLFKSSRWGSIGKCSSFYHHPNAINDFYQPNYDRGLDKDYFVFSRSDLKAYNNEEKLFFSWVEGLDIHSIGEYMGQSMYEDGEVTVYIKE